MRASNFARCSGLSLASISAGIGICPLVVDVIVLSHNPVLTFSGWNLAWAHATDDNITAITILFTGSSGFPVFDFNLIAAYCCFWSSRVRSTPTGSVPIGPITQTFTPYSEAAMLKRNIGGINEEQVRL